MKKRNLIVLTVAAFIAVTLFSATPTAKAWDTNSEGFALISARFPFDFACSECFAWRATFSSCAVYTPGEEGEEADTSTITWFHTGPEWTIETFNFNTRIGIGAGMIISDRYDPGVVAVGSLGTTWRGWLEFKTAQEGRFYEDEFDESLEDYWGRYDINGHLLNTQRYRNQFYLGGHYKHLEENGVMGPHIGFGRRLSGCFAIGELTWQWDRYGDRWGPGLTMKFLF